MVQLEETISHGKMVQLVNTIQFVKMMPLPEKNGSKWAKTIHLADCCITGLSD